LNWKEKNLVSVGGSFTWVSFALNRLPRRYFNVMAVYLRRERRNEFHRWNSLSTITNYISMSHEIKWLWNYRMKLCTERVGVSSRFQCLGNNPWNYPLRLALYCSDSEATLTLISVALLQIHKISATCIFFELVHQSKLSTPWQCGIGRQRATTIYFVDFASFVFKLRTTCSLASLGSI